MNKEHKTSESSASSISTYSTSVPPQRNIIQATKRQKEGDYNQMGDSKRRTESECTGGYGNEVAVSDPNLSHPQTHHIPRTPFNTNFLGTTQIGTAQQGTLFAHFPKHNPDQLHK